MSMSVGPSMAINSFHWCLVRSWLGTGRFLAGLFTIFSRQPVVNWLRVSGRNWFRTVITTTLKKHPTHKSEFSALSFATLCCAAKCDWSCIQMQETRTVAGNWGSKLPLTLFDVTHPGLAELSKLICSDNWLCTSMSERQRLSENSDTFCRADFFAYSICMDFSACLQPLV